MKILYAEDEMGLSMAVSEVLKMEGFEVTAVMDGLAADEILCRRRHLIWLCWIL